MRRCNPCGSWNRCSRWRKTRRGAPSDAPTSTCIRSTGTASTTARSPRPRRPSCCAAGSSMYFAGYQSFINLVVGGQKRHGGDACNDLAYMIMDASKDLGLYQPALATRIHSASPQKYLKKIVEVIKSGIGFDDMHIKHMDRRVQPADSGQPARAVPHGQKGSEPNAAAPRPERRSRRAGGGFRHAAGGSGTRGRHRGRGTAALTAMGRASTASSDRRTLAENPIRRSVWRNSRPFSRPGARRD